MERDKQIKVVTAKWHLWPISLWAAYTETFGNQVFCLKCYSSEWCSRQKWLCICGQHVWGGGERKGEENRGLGERFLYWIFSPTINKLCPLLSHGKRSHTKCKERKHKKQKFVLMTYWLFRVIFKVIVTVCGFTLRANIRTNIRPPLPPSLPLVCLPQMRTRRQNF